VYLEHYGLNEPPFNITPDPRFLFYSPKHREAFNHLLYGIRERKGFVQLTGEVGSGKTTLCRAMLETRESCGSRLSFHTVTGDHLTSVTRHAGELAEKVCACFLRAASR
jgi:type II secretory pathway predicted ATPase ExeA